MEDDIPIGGQGGGVEPDSYNDFLKPGHSYSISIQAYTSSAPLGQPMTGSFTLRELREPTFVLTASPYWDTQDAQSKITLTAAVNDPDKVVVDSTAYLKSWQTGGNPGFPTLSAKTNTAISPVHTETVSGLAVNPGVPFTAALYAAINRANEFPYTQPTPEDFWSDPSKHAELAAFEQRSVNVEAVGADTVLAGRVGAQTGAGNTVQFTFEGSVNLNSGTVPQLQYAITPLGAGPSYALTTVPFNPQEPQGITGYKTFTLIDGSGDIRISDKGKYYIEYRIILANGHTVPGSGSGTLLFVKN
jgi:hypothetical protein